MTSSAYLKPADICMQEMRALVDTQTNMDELRYATYVVAQVPMYCASTLRDTLAQDTNGNTARCIQTEWQQVWQSGPGVLVIQQAFNEHHQLEAVSAAFKDLIEQERGQTGGDHFAAAGANDRVWNALEKLCLARPELFIPYYSNDLLALAAQAWLGPNYQITSQVNSVNPGGKAQVAHRDYHLGFMSAEQAAQYPQHVHQLSAALTLQAAVAHVDMPLESGPTLFLPHSQKFNHGYLLAGHEEFHQLFAEKHVQLPLKKGDLVIFNPALLHAAGNNISEDIRRLANLLQINSAFGRAMESVDRTAMSLAAYPELQKMRQDGSLDEASIERALAACAEGYPFPTNLDKDPPLGGLAPASQQVQIQQALTEDWTLAQVEQALTTYQNKRQS